jgi:predicted RNA methylase
MSIKDDPSIITALRTCSVCGELYDDDYIHEEFTCDNCKNLRQSPVKKKSILDKINLKTLPASGYSSLLPYQMPQVKDILNNIMIILPNIIVDATCHIGGDVIHFSKLWPEVSIVAIDNDPKAIECLKINIANFCSNSQRISIFCEDSVQWLQNTTQKVDLVYFDPPWGGPSYSGEDEVSLFLSEKPIADIINSVLNKKITRKVLLKVPRNFSHSQFANQIEGQVIVYHIKKPKKKNIIAYSLILVVSEP